MNARPPVGCVFEGFVAFRAPSMVRFRVSRSKGFVTNSIAPLRIAWTAKRDRPERRHHHHRRLLASALPISRTSARPSIPGIVASVSTRSAPRSLQPPQRLLRVLRRPHGVARPSPEPPASTRRRFGSSSTIISSRLLHAATPNSNRNDAPFGRFRADDHPPAVRLRDPPAPPSNQAPCPRGFAVTKGVNSERREPPRVSPGPSSDRPRSHPSKPFKRPRSPPSPAASRAFFKQVAARLLDSVRDRSWSTPSPRLRSLTVRRTSASPKRGRSPSRGRRSRSNEAANSVGSGPHLNAASTNPRTPRKAASSRSDSSITISRQVLRLVKAASCAATRIARERVPNLVRDDGRHAARSPRGGGFRGPPCPRQRAPPPPCGRRARSARAKWAAIRAAPAAGRPGP